MKSAAEQMMERETRVALGIVPRHLFGAPLPETAWQMRGDEFLLRGEGDHYFHYRRGAGITVDRGANADLSEESLWLNGSVYAAIATMNGLLPIHASAVAHEGRVFAFTGPAGAGKSTLVAALGSRGFAMFCDDTLVLDLADPDRIQCLPGHKRLKLRADAIELTGAAPQEKVSVTVDKIYALPPAGDVGMVLPFGKLAFLEEGPDPRITTISGADRFVLIEDEHQTTQLFAAARRFDRASGFQHRARLARQIEMARFERPLDPSRFSEAIDLCVAYILENAS